jgi:ParB family chromosome partitioning protein
LDAYGRESELDEIPVGSIEPNPNQPRVHFDEEAIEELAASIKELGVLQPILVRRMGNDSYQLVAGERRWRAARQAGLTKVPAVIRDITDLASVEQALVENLHRKDLTALEEASAYQQLVEDFAFTHEQVAQRVGKSRAAVSNTLRLLHLPAAIQNLLADGKLSAGHARALLGTDDRAFQDQLARRAAIEGWSVRAVEEAIRDREIVGASSGAGGGSDTAPKPSGKARLRPPGVLEVEAQLADHLSTGVSVALGGRRGKLVIEFADLEDLDRIYRHILQPPTYD